jgi:predicted restriction endonuclease
LGLRALMVGLLHTWLMDDGVFSLTEQGGALIGDFLAGLRPEKKQD